MAAYTCEKCGMSIGTMTCGKCGQELVHDTLTKADGTSVPYLYVSRWTRQDQITDVLRPGHELRGRLRPGEDIF